MKINHAKRTVTLDGSEVARAIDAYLVAHGVHISGPRSICVSERDERGRWYVPGAEVYVDPSGKLHVNSIATEDDA